MPEANYQIVSGWLLTFEIGKDWHVCDFLNSQSNFLEAEVSSG